MNRVFLIAKLLLRRISSSIAFYPTMIAFSFIFLALFMTWVEYKPQVMSIKPSIDLFLVGTVEDGRLVLGTLVASTISLMVFSFSMVMLVLNQASANLSPRLLPGLITAKDNQIVLGVYLGTICYCLIMIVNIRTEDSGMRVPQLGILVSMLLGMSCLSLFMYFIHSISQSIQVDAILQRLYKDTSHRLKRDSDDRTWDACDINEWFDLKTLGAGYLKWVQYDELLGLCKKKDIRLKMTQRIGHFYLEGSTYLRISKKISDEDIRKIHECFVFYPQESTIDHYSFGFKQISEIAVKSLSPGINDPGTALKAIDLMVMLLVQRSRTQEAVIISDSNSEPRLYLVPTQVRDLLDEYILPIKHYARSDSLVMKRLISGLLQVLMRAQRDEDIEAAVEYLLAFRETCDRNILEEIDRRYINAEFEKHNGASETLSILQLTNVASEVPIRENLINPMQRSR